MGQSSYASALNQKDSCTEWGWANLVYLNNFFAHGNYLIFLFIIPLFLRKANADCLLVVSAKSNKPSIGWPSQGLSIRHEYSLQLFLAFRPCDIAMVPAEISLCKYLRSPMENLLCFIDISMLVTNKITFHLRICFPRIFASCHGYYFNYIF